MEFNVRATWPHSWRVLRLATLPDGLRKKVRGSWPSSGPTAAHNDCNFLRKGSLNFMELPHGSLRRNDIMGRSTLDSGENKGT
jgi:hypothetical protein